MMRLFVLHGSGNQAAITNLTGHPAISFPTGFNKKNTPTSITLIGKLYDEATILAIAKIYQDFLLPGTKYILIFS